MNEKIFSPLILISIYDEEIEKKRIEGYYFINDASEDMMRLWYLIMPPPRTSHDGQKRGVIAKMIQYSIGRDLIYIIDNFYIKSTVKTYMHASSKMSSLLEVCSQLTCQHSTQQNTHAVAVPQFINNVRSYLKLIESSIGTLKACGQKIRPEAFIRRASLAKSRGRIHIFKNAFTQQAFICHITAKCQSPIRNIGLMIILIYQLR